MFFHCSCSYQMNRSKYCVNLMNNFKLKLSNIFIAVAVLQWRNFVHLVKSIRFEISTFQLTRWTWPSHWQNYKADAHGCLWRIFSTLFWLFWAEANNWKNGWKARNSKCEKVKKDMFSVFKLEAFLSFYTWLAA